MSGGSYNYLCSAFDAEDLIAKRSSLYAMAERLERIDGAEDAAIETRELIADLAAFDVRVQAHARRLTGVWKAIEWIDSSDWADDELAAALVEYRGLTP